MPHFADRARRSRARRAETGARRGFRSRLARLRTAHGSAQGTRERSSGWLPSAGRASTRRSSWRPARRRGGRFRPVSDWSSGRRRRDRGSCSSTRRGRGRRKPARGRRRIDVGRAAWSGPPTLATATTGGAHERAATPAYRGVRHPRAGRARAAASAGPRMPGRRRSRVDTRSAAEGLRLRRAPRLSLAAERPTRSPSSPRRMCCRSRAARS